MAIKLCLTTEQKFYCMIGLVGSFFFVEIVSGYVCNSLALISDAFHMLSDLIALIVGLAALRISKLKSERNTFGWARAEVMGALVNAVFMLAVCLTIVLESIERFLHVSPIEKPFLLLVIGFGGLLINVIAFFLFISGETEPTHQKQPRRRAIRPHRRQQRIHHDEAENDAIPLQNMGESTTKQPPKVKKERSMNIAAVLRHVIGDAMGSVIVCVVAILIWQLEGQLWVSYLDPALSLCLVGAMSSSTFPLLNEASQVLIQQCPPAYRKPEFRERLLAALRNAGVVSYHSLQIWRLSGSRLVASIHVVLKDTDVIGSFMEIADEIRDFFHSENVHSVTIQPEIEGIALNCHQHNHHDDEHGHHSAVPCCCNVVVTDGVAVLAGESFANVDFSAATAATSRGKRLLQKLMHAESTSCLFAAASTDEPGKVIHHCHPIISCSPDFLS